MAAAAPLSVPTDFRPQDGLRRPGMRATRTALRRVLGVDPMPGPEIVEAFVGDIEAASSLRR